MEKSRKSNIELLRIISMFLIVMHHFALHSKLYFSAEIITINQLWCEFIEMGGKIGVVIFVLISGYFLITSTSVDILKTVKMILQVTFYSLGIYCIMCATSIEKWNYRDFVESLFPIIFEKYWFFSAYFVLYLLHPFINKALTNLDKEEYKKMLLLMFVMWSVIPSFFNNSFQANSLVLFCFIYAVGGYIKLYNCLENIDNKKIFVGFSIIILIKFLVVIAWDAFSLKYVNNWSRFAFYDINNFMTLIISVLIFLYFRNIKLENSNFINMISATTFGIYLIHDNTILRNFIWVNIFKSYLYVKSDIFIIYSLLACIIVFLASLLVELLRINLLEKNYMKLIKKITKFFMKNINNCI